PGGVRGRPDWRCWPARCAPGSGYWRPGAPPPVTRSTQWCRNGNGSPPGATQDLRDPTPGGRHPTPPPRADPPPPSPCHRGNRWFDPGERTRHGRRADHPRVQPPAALVLVYVLADPVLVLGGLHDHVVLAVVAA